MRKFLFSQMTDEARRRDLGGPPWAQTRPRRGPLVGRTWGVSGHPGPPLTEIFSHISSPREPKVEGERREVFRRRYEAENTRERKALRQAEICRGKLPPEGEIDAIVTAITLDFIGIIIITISTIISSLIPNHMMSRE